MQLALLGWHSSSQVKCIEITQTTLTPHGIISVGPARRARLTGAWAPTPPIRRQATTQTLRLHEVTAAAGTQKAARPHSKLSASSAYAQPAALRPTPRHQPGFRPPAAPDWHSCAKRRPRLRPRRFSGYCPRCSASPAAKPSCSSDLFSTESAARPLHDVDVEVKLLQPQPAYAASACSARARARLSQYASASTLTGASLRATPAQLRRPQLVQHVGHLVQEQLRCTQRQAAQHGRERPRCT